jgi:hypothetical protein
LVAFLLLIFGSDTGLPVRLLLLTGLLPAAALLLAAFAALLALLITLIGHLCSLSWIKDNAPPQPRVPSPT